MYLHKLIDSYLQWLSKNRAPSTHKVRGYVLCHFKKHVPNRPAERLLPQDVEAWLDQAGVNPTTRGDRITLLISIFRWGQRRAHVKTNPLEGMERPAPNVRRDFIPPELLGDLVAAAREQDTDFGQLVAFLVETGARAEEVLKMQMEHIDKEAVRLPATLAKGRTRVRVVYLPPVAQTIVQEIWAQRTTGPLFLDGRGRPWTKHTMKLQFEKLRATLGIPTLCATMLRHSFAHARLAAGQDPLLVSKLLGHVDTRMLATRYGHLEDSNVLAKAATSVSLL